MLRAIVTIVCGLAEHQNLSRCGHVASYMNLLHASAQLDLNQGSYVIEKGVFELAAKAACKLTKAVVQQKLVARPALWHEMMRRTIMGSRSLKCVRPANALARFHAHGGSSLSISTHVVAVPLRACNALSKERFIVIPHFGSMLSEAAVPCVQETLHYRIKV
eukprot:5319973-Amphidinium_carterae.1